MDKILSGDSMLSVTTIMPNKNMYYFEGSIVQSSSKYQNIKNKHDIEENELNY